MTGSPLSCFDRRCVLLSFTVVTEHKAQIRMMSIHNEQLTTFVQRFKKEVEQKLEDENPLPAKPGDTGSIWDSLTKTLGYSNFMLNNLMQMQR